MKYDYIVVGAGAAGAILATRLSEDPNKSVLLLEAGPDYPDLDALPEELKYGYKTTAEPSGPGKHNWQFRARATDKAEINLPRGKVTGGSTAINGQIFLRGIPEDYDNWAASGNDKWSFREILPYLNRIETDTTYRDNPGDFHGTDGPIICHRFPRESWYPQAQAFEKACMDAGFSICDDANAPEGTGVSPIPLNNPDGIRWSTAIGYLGQSRHRLNLTIRPNVSVKRILFDTQESRPKAIGVKAVSNEQEFVVKGEEIILSAGAIGSPQILMLSGIGPESHLKEHGIDPILDSPGVGQNLRDHPGVKIIWDAKSGIELDTLGPRTQVCLRYKADGSKLDNDMMIFMYTAIPSSFKTGGARDEAPNLSAGVYLYLAQGKGELKLKSNDYREHPYVDFNYLVETEDLRRMRDGVRMVVEMEKHPAMSSLIAKRLQPMGSDLESDDALDNWLKREAHTGHHISCTAKMGPETDPMAVVDQVGNVHGVDQLRIADASIMPDCIRANTNATVMMIGERISDFITHEQ